jgi:hypothetical protein
LRHKLFCRRENKEPAGDKNSRALLEKVLAHEKDGGIHLYLLPRTVCAEENKKLHLSLSHWEQRKNKKLAFERAENGGGGRRWGVVAL